MEQVQALLVGSQNLQTMLTCKLGDFSKSVFFVVRSAAA